MINIHKQTAFDKYNKLQKFGKENTKRISFMERILKIIVKETDSSANVGQILRTQAGLTKKQISQAKFRSEGITRNDVKCRVTDPALSGDILTVCLEESHVSGSDHLIMPPDHLPPLQVLYEDQDILAVNKPAGIVTHPSGSHYHDSLSNQAAWYFHSRGKNVTIRSVGRLDKETSGIVVFAKNQTAAARLQQQRSNGGYQKEYLALVHGFLPADYRVWHTINLPIAPDPEDFRKMTCIPSFSGPGLPPQYKNAVTHYRVLKSTPQWSVLSLRLDTGRTHQIRVHMKASGHPLLGDTLYSGSRAIPAPFSFTRTALHAWKVSLIQPFENKKIQIQAEPPNDFYVC